MCVCVCVLGGLGIFGSGVQSLQGLGSYAVCMFYMLRAGLGSRGTRLRQLPCTWLKQEPSP